MKGIKHTCVWFFMLTKRYLKKPLFIITILMIPVLVLALRFSTGKDEAAVRVALYTQETKDNELAMETMEYLVNNSGSTIAFYQVDSEEKIYDDVKSGYAVCGYEFPMDFETAVKNFVQGNSDNLPFENAMIKCIRKEETNFAKIAEEIVFSAFYEHFAHEILLDFMMNRGENGEISMEGEDKALLEEYYHSYDIHDELFQFEYVDGTENTLLTEENTSFLLLPVRGMILVMILLGAMTGGIVLYQDKERGVFQSITMNRRGIINYIYILIPAVLAGIVGLAGIWFAGIYTNTVKELTVMGLYILLVTGIGNLLRRIFRDIHWFVSFIPIFLMLNIIICPVFIDISGVFPQIKHIQSILPVYYGLNSLYDTNIRMFMGMIVIILFLGTVKDHN